MALDWLDRPIRHGDRFVALGLCRVVSGKRAWLLRPGRGETGQWASVPVILTDPAGLTSALRVPWYRYDVVQWEVQGAYRLRIRMGNAPGVLTGPVETVDGRFT